MLTNLLLREVTQEKNVLKHSLSNLPQIVYLKGGHSSNLIEQTFVDADVFDFILALRSMKCFILGEGENGGPEAGSGVQEVM